MKVAAQLDGLNIHNYATLSWKKPSHQSFLLCVVIYGVDSDWLQAEEVGEKTSATAAETEATLEETRMQLVRSQAEVVRLAQIRDDVENEVRELTASLFQVTIDTGQILGREPLSHGFLQPSGSPPMRLPNPSDVAPISHSDGKRCSYHPTTSLSNKTKGKKWRKKNLFF